MSAMVSLQVEDREIRSTGDPGSRAGADSCVHLSVPDLRLGQGDTGTLGDARGL